MNGVQFIPTNQTANSPVSYVGSSDTVTNAQAALLLAGRAGTDSTPETGASIDGVTARMCDWGVVQNVDSAGNLKLRRYSDYTGNPADAYVVDATYGLLGHSGSPGGYIQALVGGYSLGTPLASSDTNLLAATAMPGAASANGILGATTLSSGTQIITAGITNPAGLVPTVVANQTDEFSNVIINYTDLLGNTGQVLQLPLNGTTTVVATLNLIPNGVNTIQSIALGPQTSASTVTVEVGTKGLVVVAGLSNPDVPRVPLLKGSTSGINSTQEVLGSDAQGSQVYGAATANGASVVDFTVAIATVTSVLIGPQNAGGNTMEFGYSDALGLPYHMDHDGYIQGQFGTVHEATRATVTFDGVNLCGNTVTLNSALDGSHEVVVDFIRCDAPVSFTTDNNLFP